MQSPSDPWSTMQSSARFWPSGSRSPPSVKMVGTTGQTPRYGLSMQLVLPPNP